jgi:hypothetical protein
MPIRRFEFILSRVSREPRLFPFLAGFLEKYSGWRTYSAEYTVAPSERLIETGRFGKER